INSVNLKKAFTLIELLVVIAIISLLSAVVLNSLASARMKANDAKISEDLRQFRIAAELYFNDNHTYPPTNGTSLNNRNDSSLQYSDKSGWSNRLSFFVKTAEAATVRHTKTQLCANFDNVASALVVRKYLASVPIHPYDDDSKGVCYKAVNAENTFSAYAPLTTTISVGSGASAGIISKRTGFILGDTSPVGVGKLVDATVAVNSNETPYPIGTDGTTATVVSSSADVVYGIVAGTPGSAGAGSNIIPNTSSTAPILMVNGDLCTVDSECQSGICASGGRCVGAVGVACSSDDVCQSNICSSGGKCTNDPKPNGGSCTNDNQCEYHLCRNDVCTDPEEPYRIIGASCSVNDDCDSGFCGFTLDNSPSGYSRTCSYGGIGNLCQSNDQCSTNFCGINGFCTYPEGHECTADNECEYGCLNNSCGSHWKPTGEGCWYGNECQSSSCLSNVCL
ncbi:MAG: type II secretion system protein, partial [bacterium]